MFSSSSGGGWCNVQQQQQWRVEGRRQVVRRRVVQ
jgi:hypothetical protein